MFDNLATVLVQAIGFFGVFGFFVYQLLSEGKKPINTKINSSRKKVNDSKNINDKPKKKVFFSRKNEPINDVSKPIKKGLFGRKSIPLEDIKKRSKKGWFN